jgi:hypothetical protein
MFRVPADTRLPNTTNWQVNQLTPAQWNQPAKTGNTKAS